MSDRINQSTDRGDRDREGRRLRGGVLDRLRRDNRRGLRLRLRRRGAGDLEMGEEIISD